MDPTTPQSYWMQKNKQYILDQMEVRGFDQAAHWETMKKSTKAELYMFVKQLIEKDKW